MKIIPVIDLQAGQVVQARGGLRRHYQPLQSPLARSSEPAAVIAGLQALYRFDTIYVADLDAIEDCGHHGAIVDALLKQFSNYEFWLDAGRIDNHRFDTARLKHVIGTESYQAGETAEALSRQPQSILSLDFMNDELLGDSEILAQVQQWPHDIIVMTLNRVGQNQGPAIERLRELQEQNPDRRFYAAGGIRHDDDLQQLADCSIHGALLATALHQGTIRTCRHRHN